jgi:hypothetical protein
LTSAPTAGTVNQFTPAYAIYQNRKPVRVALFNYVTDPSGNNALTLTISIGGEQTGQPDVTPAEVEVKYVFSFFLWIGLGVGRANQFVIDICRPPPYPLLCKADTAFEMCRGSNSWG